MPIILMKNNKVGKHNPSRFQTMLQTYSNQNSVVFAYIHTFTRVCMHTHTHTHTKANGLLKFNGEPRNKTTHPHMLS